MTTTAAIYARLSDVAKGDTEGIERQVRQGEQLAERLGLEVVERLVDNDVSAVSRKKRQAYLRLMEGIEQNAWDVVILRSLDRWVRRPRELEDIIDVVEKSSVRVESYAGGRIDLRSRQGQVLARIMTAINYDEVQATKERLKLWHKDRAERGLPHVGAPGYGYNPDKVTINEEQAARIREAAARVLAGDALLAIARDWNERGVPGPRGEWKPTAIRRLLVSPRTAGLRVHNEVLTRATWPAILDRDTWDEVGRFLRRPDRRSPGPRTPKLLTGLASCGLCRETLNSKVMHGSRRYYCRHCGGIVVFADALEGHVVADLCVMVDTIHLKAGPDRVQLAELVGRLEADLDELAADAAAGRVELREWKVLRQGITARIDAAREELAASSRDVSWAGRGEMLRDEWDHMTPPEQRRVLAGWITDIRVDSAIPGRNRFDKDRVTISYRG